MRFQMEIGYLPWIASMFQDNNRLPMFRKFGYLYPIWCYSEVFVNFPHHLHRDRDATFIVGSKSLVAATGMTNTGNNLIAWDTLAPPSSNRQSISCHEGTSLNYDHMCPSLHLLMSIFVFFFLLP